LAHAGVAASDRHSFRRRFILLENLVEFAAVPIVSVKYAVIVVSTIPIMM
jgi:hypothetical protein